MDKHANGYVRKMSPPIKDTCIDRVNGQKSKMDGKNDGGQREIRDKGTSQTHG